MIDRRNVLKQIGAACGCGIVGLPKLTQSSPQPLEGFCGGAGVYTSPSVKETFDPAPEAVAVIERMVRSVGLMSKFIIRAGEFTNGSTAVAGKRGTELYIVYDRAKFSMKNAKINYTDLGILAHEIGHHANGHFRIPGGSRPDIELEADHFSGFAMARYGVPSLDKALSWTRLVSLSGSESHPPRAARVKALTAGWMAAKNFSDMETAAHCKPDWVGDVIEIEGQQCRLVQVCGADGPETRLACQSRTGQWIWK